MSARTITGGLLVAIAVVAAGCDDESPAPASTTTIPVPATPSTSTTAAETSTTSPPAAEPSGPAETATEDPRVTARERAAERTVREYVAALDSGDGVAVCILLAPGALASLELPEPRPGCADSLSASIGYRDPRGLPVWDGARVTRVRVVDLSATGDEAKVIATVVTQFADRPEVSVEDDIVYLVRGGGRWLVAKPSSTLYRAVGIADVPPSVLSPPN
jgi:hypothetical protein